MKCDACGAPVESGKCIYCGKDFREVPELVENKSDSVSNKVRVYKKADFILKKGRKQKNNRK